MVKKDGFKRKVDNKMRYYGDTDLEKKEIRVNKSKKKNKKSGDILNTIVHEEMHADHPRMHERTIRRLTKAKIERMTPDRKQKYYALYQ
jgi:hypothetical protein